MIWQCRTEGCRFECVSNLLALAHSRVAVSVLGIFFRSMRHTLRREVGPKTDEQIGP